MPGQRMSYPEQSASRKVTALSDFEYRVWEQTKLSSDDFGVMPYTSTIIRADNLRLRKATEKQVFDALSRLVSLGLLLVFEHQGESYVCAPEWQKWQQVRFPRKTPRPKPSNSVLQHCEPLTQALMEKHPGGKAWKRDDSETVTELSRDNHVNGHEIKVRLIPANANASDLPEGTGDWFWSEWRRVMGRRIALPAMPRVVDIPAIVGICEAVPDRSALVDALKRFEAMPEPERNRLGIKSLTLGYFKMALPDLVKPAPVSCRHGHKPPCHDDVTCSRRYQDDCRRGVAV